MFILRPLMKFQHSAVSQQTEQVALLANIHTNSFAEQPFFALPCSHFIEKDSLKSLGKLKEQKLVIVMYLKWSYCRLTFIFVMTYTFTTPDILAS